MSDRTERIGQVIGHYRLTRFIGHGGFADVYLGEHIYLGTQAAIKLLTTRLSEEETMHFQHEAQVIAQLEHPHIVRILDFGIEEQLPFLVMSYAPYGSLRQRYPRGTRLPIETVVAYVNRSPARSSTHTSSVLFIVILSQKICYWGATTKCFSAILDWLWSRKVHPVIIHAMSQEPLPIWL